MDFNIFDSDEFQKIVLEKDEIDDIEIEEESYQYSIQFIVYDNDNTKIDIDLIIKKMNYFFSLSSVIDRFHINENYMISRNQTSLFIYFFLFDNSTLSVLINFFKFFINFCY